MSKSPISKLYERCQIHMLQLKEKYFFNGISWECIIYVYKNNKLLIRSKNLGLNKKTAKTLACEIIMENTKFLTKFPERVVIKDSTPEDYNQNNYILFGKEFIRKRNYQVSYQVLDLSKLTSKYIAIDTEGRTKPTQKPLMIQIANQDLCVILKYQNHEEEIQRFLNSKKVFVFGGENEFKIMKFTPRKFIEVQTNINMSLKKEAGKYHQVKESFNKPDRYFYDNVYWVKPTKAHLIYAAFDALNTYLLGIRMLT